MSALRLSKVSSMITSSPGTALMTPISRSASRFACPFTKLPVLKTSVSCAAGASEWPSRWRRRKPISLVQDAHGSDGFGPKWNSSCSDAAKPKFACWSGVRYPRMPAPPWVATGVTCTSASPRDMPGTPMADTMPGPFGNGSP